MDQLQVFRERIRAKPILVFIAVPVAQQCFVDAHQIGSASVHRIHNGRLGPRHPAIVRRPRVGRVLDLFVAPSGLARLTFLEINSVATSNKSCQI
jgi:hypothetical protein